MEGVPVNIGSWGLVRIFQEGGRLCRRHFSVFLPFILISIFPAALIKTLYLQFLYALHFHPPDTEPRSSLTMVPFNLVSSVPTLLIPLGAVMLFYILTTTIYVRGCERWHTESLAMSVILAFVIKGRETENPVLRTTTTEHSLYERVRKTSKGKKLKACAVGFVCVVVYALVSNGGVHFTPKEVACMGLPPGTIFVFTLLITLLSTATTVYLLLVNLVMFIWMCSPRCPS